MTFLQRVLQAIGLIPMFVHGVESMFGARGGEEKKESAISLVSTAIRLGEAVGNREIVDEEKFRAGLSKVIDGK